MILPLSHEERPVIKHLYVHVPFCTHICPYCSFYKTPNSLPQINVYIPALKQELAWALENFDLQPETIFFGGGTPSALSISQLETLFSDWPLASQPTQEYTLEANPTNISPDKARLLREIGFNRISLGVQAFDAPSLEVLGRTHDAAQVRKTVHILREAGFTNLNLDLMFALPGQSMEQWQASLDAALELEPQHISAYNLNYEEDTEFFEKLQAGYHRINQDQEQTFFRRGIESLGRAGFEHYEISNYARPGFQSSHNQGYWNGSDHLGLGPGASSTVGHLRWKNIPNTLLYAEALKLKGEPLREMEVLSAESKRNERILLGLRTSWGLKRDVVEEKKEQVAQLEKEGLIELTETHLRLTSAGQLVADSVTEHLI